MTNQSNCNTSTQPRKILVIAEYLAKWFSGGKIIRNYILRSGPTIGMSGWFHLLS